MDSLKNKLKEAYDSSLPPPRGHVDRFRDKLTSAHTPKQRRGVFLLWTSAAAVVLILVLLVVTQQIQQEEQRAATVRSSERSYSHKLAEDILIERIHKSEPHEDIDSPLIRRLRAELIGLRNEQAKLQNLIKENPGNAATENALRENFGHQLKTIERLRFAMHIVATHEHPSSSHQPNF